MEDPILTGLEKFEKHVFGVAVIGAKIITLIALLLLAGIVEATLVYKTYKMESIEWHVTEAHAASDSPLISSAQTGDPPVEEEAARQIIEALGAATKRRRFI